MESLYTYICIINIYDLITFSTLIKCKILNRLVLYNNNNNNNNNFKVWMPNRRFWVDSLIEQKHYYSVIENSHEIHTFTSTL